MGLPVAHNRGSGYARAAERLSALFGPFWRRPRFAWFLTVLGLVAYVLAAAIWVRPLALNNSILSRLGLFVAAVLIALFLGTLVLPTLESLRPRAGPSFAIAAVIMLAVSLFLWGANLEAEWGLTDDHEIVRMLGPDRVLGLDEVPGLIAQSEAGQAFQLLRFRPVYWTLRILETLI